MNLSLKAPSAGTIAAMRRRSSSSSACCRRANSRSAGRPNALGANPIETITRASGEWALRFLLITLAVTPLRRLTGLHWLLRLRRMLGLYAFAYAAAHFTIYLWLDQFFDWGAIARDILERPFITVGFAAFVLLIPLAATSNSFAIRRLGGRQWQALHRSVYAIAIFAVLHFWWLVKADIGRPADLRAASSPCCSACAAGGASSSAAASSRCRRRRSTWRRR
jgi:sulfoxide reductase heme-binding subunit YedZ